MIIILLVSLHVDIVRTCTSGVTYVSMLLYLVIIVQFQPFKCKVEKLSYFVFILIITLIILLNIKLNKYF